MIPYEEGYLAEQQAEPFRNQLEKPCTCQFCGTDLSKEPIQYYVPHEDGWTVKGLKVKAWLFIKCPTKKCHYDWALWKLGVPRK